MISCPWACESELRNDSGSHPELRTLLAELSHSKESPANYTEWAFPWARKVITKISSEGWTGRPEVKTLGKLMKIQYIVLMQKGKKRRKGEKKKQGARRRTQILKRTSDSCHLHTEVEVYVQACLPTSTPHQVLCGCGQAGAGHQGLPLLFALLPGLIDY